MDKSPMPRCETAGWPMGWDRHWVSEARNVQSSLDMSETVIGASHSSRAAPVLVVSRGWWTSAWLRALAAYLLLPNLLFAILGQFVFVTRPAINVDYLLLGCVAGL